MQSRPKSQLLRYQCRLDNASQPSPIFFPMTHEVQWGIGLHTWRCMNTNVMLDLGLQLTSEQATLSRNLFLSPRLIYGSARERGKGDSNARAAFSAHTKSRCRDVELRSAQGPCEPKGCEDKHETLNKTVQCQWNQHRSSLLRSLLLLLAGKYHRSHCMSSTIP